MNLVVPPPIVFVLIAAAMWWVGRSFEHGKYSFSYQTPIALALVGLGAALAALGLRSFIAARTTPNPMRPTRATHLVTSGVYSFSRNPMYLGDLIMLAGIAVWTGSVLNAPLLAVFVWYIDRYQIAREERALTEVFGDQYAAYCVKVRRWV
jgi:protein-S-isoprenylcysteine O-methyltransferase Ste14